MFSFPAPILHPILIPNPNKFMSLAGYDTLFVMKSMGRHSLEPVIFFLNFRFCALFFQLSLFCYFCDSIFCQTKSPLLKKTKPARTCYSRMLPQTHEQEVGMISLSSSRNNEKFSILLMAVPSIIFRLSSFISNARELAWKNMVFATMKTPVESYENVHFAEI